MNAKQIISDLQKSGAKFTIHTDIAYGRGINGIGYENYCTREEIGESLKTVVCRTFLPKDDHLVIIEDYIPPEIPWNRKAEKKPYTRELYIDYGRITHITKYV